MQKNKERQDRRLLEISEVGLSELAFVLVTLAVPVILGLAMVRGMAVLTKKREKKFKNDSN